jgi:antitoxin component of MazEF toxin-antitoxin module
MRARIVKIGNSKGIRIPKPLLEQTGIVNDVDLEAEDDRIIFRPVVRPRRKKKTASGKARSAHCFLFPIFSLLLPRNP